MLHHLARAEGAREPRRHLVRPREQQAAAHAAVEPVDRPEPMWPTEGVAVGDDARITRAVRLRQHPSRLIQRKHVTVLVEKDRTESAAAHAERRFRCARTE